MKTFFLIVYFVLCSFLLPRPWAQDITDVASFKKQIIDAKGPAALRDLFEGMKEVYFKDNKYTECIQFIASLEKKKDILPYIHYYTALCRYHQLKYLEETQDWDEYFSQGNAYRDDIVENVTKAIDETQPTDPTHLYALLLSWRFHKDMQDNLDEELLEKMIAAVREYASSGSYLLPMREIGDQLYAYGLNARAKEVYAIYVEKLLASTERKSELPVIAESFLKEGNVQLSERIYDAYLDGLLSVVPPPPEGLSILTSIALLYCYSDDKPHDVFYAEKLFQKIEDLYGKDALNEDLWYRRALNVEKDKEYHKSKELYEQLLMRFPSTRYADEVRFKLGIIYAYVLRDRSKGREYFEYIAEQETVSPQVIASLYQLGLLSQWDKDRASAETYYKRLLEKAGNGFQDVVNLVNERMKEMQEGKDIEYNLKLFLDMAFQNEYASFNMTKINLIAHPFSLEKEKNSDITSHPYLSETGCFQIELHYFWSGDTGTTQPSSDESSFNTTQQYPGTKVVNLVVSSPTGIIDRDLIFMDIQ
jgi:tetratricopeptide (TPR) repeat protein